MRPASRTGSRGKRFADPLAARRDTAPAFVPRPFTLDAARPPVRIHPGALLSAVHVADFAVVLLVGLVTLASQPSLWPLRALPVTAGALVMMLMARVLESGPRQPQQLIRQRLTRQTADGAVHALTAFAFALLVTVAVLQPDAETRLPFVEWMFAWATSSVAGVAAVRVVLWQLLARWRRAGRLKQVVAIYGTGDHAGRLVEHLRDMSEAIDIVGVFDDRTSRRAVPFALRAMPHGTTDDLVELSRLYEIDRIIVALPHSAEQRLLEILRKLHKMPVEISLAPDMVGFSIPTKHHDHYAGLPLIDVYGRPLSFGQNLLKTTFDRAAALLGLVAISPLLLTVALLIRLDSKGPVLFRQNRYGFGDRVIGVYKFRTMKAELADTNGEKQTEVNDPRITRIGGFLRRWSIDELPQLLNVLRGELSLVGPRPHAVSMRVKQRRNEDIVPDYALRHHVKPGITGWAQVNGCHGPVETERHLKQRVAYDLDYINNWSLWFDLRILLRTLFIAFGHREAY
jgi:Undecaprenyl-phosphate glucose phosphotransferase